MDVGAAFTYFKRDEQWVNKFLIGSLLIISIIGIIPVMGWFLEIIRRQPVVFSGDECFEKPPGPAAGTAEEVRLSRGQACFPFRQGPADPPGQTG